MQQLGLQQIAPPHQIEILGRPVEQRRMHPFFACESDALVRRQQCAAAVIAASSTDATIASSIMAATPSATALIVAAAIVFAASAAASRSRSSSTNACTCTCTCTSTCTSVAASITKLQPHAIAVQQHQLAIDAWECGKHRILFDLGDRQA
ncbi:hypothetical protein GGR60_003104 [Xanthomonas arboricola]|nr:hypothetical protein [Xanthomonas euroxanthea]